MGTERLEKRFADLKAKGRTAFVPFVTAEDPDAQTSLALLNGFAKQGADLIELGVPFSDPMADGPAIQAGSLRALKSGASLKGTLSLVRRFRESDTDTPIVLMGYFNPVLAYGLEAFAADAHGAGADGLILVDLPPEEENEFRPIAEQAGLSIIRLIAPTTGDERLHQVTRGLTGWVYLISITGVTGTKSIDVEAIRPHVERTRKAAGLPVGVGFGVKTAEDARAVAEIADAVVVGSAIVERIRTNLSEDGSPRSGLVDDVVGFASGLADAVHAVAKAKESVS